jgi:glycosyltransferase involved in cell wall biosynthesis
MFISCLFPVLKADIINPRVPDYSGICGGYWGKILKKPSFISQIDDWHSRVVNFTSRTQGLVRLGLKKHLQLYSIFEQRLCRTGLVFVQGEHMLNFYSSNPKINLCVSSSIYENQIVPPRQTCLRSDECRLLSVGRLVSIKGHVDLIKALAILKKKDSKCHYKLTLVGEGELKKSLCDLAKELGVNEQLQFLGQLGRNEILEIFDDSDIFCLPSHSEGTPKVILEAMTRALPVVATNVGGIPTTVWHEQTGLLVPARNPEALASSIKRIFDDSILREKCILGGLSISRKHTVDKEWGKMMQIVQQAYPNLWTRKKAN